jgi:hypothetical protein
LEFPQKSAQQQFLGDWQLALVHTSENPERLFFELVQASGFSPAARLDLIKPKNRSYSVAASASGGTNGVRVSAIHSLT